MANQMKTTRLKEQIARLGQEIQRPEKPEAQRLETRGEQISLTDPDARSMVTGGHDSGVVGYNVQIAIDTQNHLIVTHDVTITGNDTSQLARMSKLAKATLEIDQLQVIADRGYFNSPGFFACEEANIIMTLPKPQTTSNRKKGLFVKADFRYMLEEDVYICPAGQQLRRRTINEEKGLALHRYWTNLCGSCRKKGHCTSRKERRVSRWEHEHVVEAVQRRLDENPQAMRTRRETVEHPVGTIKARMGATHFLMKTLSRVVTEIALHVLAYNLTKVMNIIGIAPLVRAIRA